MVAKADMLAFSGALTRHVETIYKNSVRAQRRAQIVNRKTGNTLSSEPGNNIHFYSPYKSVRLYNLSRPNVDVRCQNKQLKYK